MRTPDADVQWRNAPIRTAPRPYLRRIALSQEGAEEGSHMGVPDSRVGGRIFATLASQGYGNSMLPLEQQGQTSCENCQRFSYRFRVLGEEWE